MTALSPQARPHTRTVVRNAVLLVVLAVVAAVLLPTVASDAKQKTTLSKTGVVTHGATKSTKYTVGWLLECKYSHSLKDDPIVHPGMPGMAHLHDFFGNKAADASSTGASLQRTPATTCDTSADSASYWMPALLVNATTISPIASSQQIYYRSRYAADVTVEPMPTDLRIVIGNMNATSLADNSALSDGQIRWECHGSDKHYTTPPSCGKEYLLENVNFPSCWDGTLTHVNDSAHMAYVGDDQDRCPSGFPHALPRISIKVKYYVPKGATVTLSSGSVYSAHADFMNGWQTAGMRYLVDKCLNAHVSCGTSPVAPMGS